MFKSGDLVQFLDESEKCEVIYVGGTQVAIRHPEEGLLVVEEDEIEFYTDPAVSGTNNKGVSMANNVVGQVVGGAPIALNGVSTVADVAARLGATDRIATVNGSPADHSTVLSDNAFVMFSDKKKGGL